MKRIIFIQPIPLTAIKEKMFYIQELMAFGFEVQFWNLAPFQFPGLTLTGEIKPEYNIDVPSFARFEQMLEQTDIQNTIFIADLDEGWTNRRLLLRLRQKKCLLVRMYIHTGIGCNQFTLWQNFIYLLSRTPVNAAKYAVRGLQYKWLMWRHGFFKNPYACFISSGSNPHIDIHINHYDWEQFKISAEQPAEVKGKYAVFIDQYFPLHPEFIRMSATGEADVEAVVHYRKKMCCLFDRIEQKYGLKVVIAAHPQARYDHQTFEGRQIVKYKTANLVNHAQQVIMHHSASFGYVIMADKPLALVTTDHLSSYNLIAKQLKYFSSHFHLPLFNLDHVSPDQVDIRKIAQGLRKKYIYGYLTTQGIENKQTANILCQTLFKL